MYCKFILVILKILKYYFFDFFFTNISYLLLSLFSFSSCAFDIFILQFSLFYVVFLIFTVISLFYSLFYLVLIIIFFGFFLSLYQLELFTAFLWLAECVVIFVSLMLLFYIAVYDSTDKTNITLNNLKLGSLFFGFWFLVFNLVFFSETEFYIPIELSINLI